MLRDYQDDDFIDDRGQTMDSIAAGMTVWGLQVKQIAHELAKTHFRNGLRLQHIVPE